MSDSKPGFFARLVLAFVAWWRTLLSADFAAGVVQLRRGALPASTRRRDDEDEEDEEDEEPAKPEPVVLREPTPEAAMQLLGILQREGRFVDFLMEDVSEFSDEEIGAAARVVHEGCKRAVDEHFDLEPVHDAEEGESVTVEEGFDAAEIRITGNVVGDPPFEGVLQHRGWRSTKVKLPKIVEEHDVSVLAPAEVEL